jgi:crossover junction endodeoxyribonuclease RuvC
MIILGIDPGYATLGWGIIKKEKSIITFLHCGAIFTAAELSFEKRLDEIYKSLSLLFETYKPDEVALEKLYFSTNTKTALDVAHARGVILLSCVQHHIPVASYGPLTVKQTITGDGKADKLQVQTMVKRILKLSSIPKPDDVADAVAIALTHAYTNKL